MALSLTSSLISYFSIISIYTQIPYNSIWILQRSIRVYLLIQASIYTIEGNLSHSIVLIIQAIKYNYPIRSKYDH